MHELSFKTKFLNVFRNVGRIRFIEKLLTKLSKGSDHKDFIAKLIPNHYQYPIGSSRIVRRNGINYELDISDYVDHNIYFGLSTEENPIIYDSIRDGDVVFDVGTNIGHVLLKMAQINPGGEVHGFEPHPFNYNKALKNVSLNSFNRIRINNLAVSDEEGELSFSDDFSRNMGGVSLNKGSGNQKVRALTLDNYVCDNNIQKVDFIKIDVEGFELKVVKGSKNILKKYSPVLFIEVNDAFLSSKGDSAQSLIQELIDSGYKIKRADSKEFVDASYDFIGKHFDIICHKQHL